MVAYPMVASERHCKCSVSALKRPREHAESSFIIHTKSLILKYNKIIKDSSALEEEEV